MFKSDKLNTRVVSLNVGIGGQADVPNQDGGARVAREQDSRPRGMELDGRDGLPVASHLLVAMQILYIYIDKTFTSTQEKQHI